MNPADRAAVLRRLLREFLLEHAAELGIDPASVTAPRPNAVAARDPSSRVVSIDFGDYGPSR